MTGISRGNDKFHSITWSLSPPVEGKASDWPCGKYPTLSQTWHVARGKVKTYMVHTDGKELITGICGPGDCVGYIAAVHGGSYTDNAQVLEESALVVISRPEFLRLLAGDPAFVRQMIKWLSRSTRVQESGFAYPHAERFQKGKAYRDQPRGCGHEFRNSKIMGCCL